ncbi:MAG: tRNA (guanosine(37)-N1)-methyltransferase TrmD [Alphaproteobacteria bacterium]|nr:tRNA (guanosine(37)-N1)-methyltransferase TrmD [Alphaproteobacteria bacterium]
MWHVQVLTLFPEMFPGSLQYSLAGKAKEIGIWSLKTLNIRDFTADKYKTVDDTSFGGGPGMVMRPDVVHESMCLAVQNNPSARKIYLTPKGYPLTQKVVENLASSSGIILLCGRYEGIDQRVIDAHQMEEISLGDFVLSGGEPAALALIDACVRLLPGVLKQKDTLQEESFAQGLLEYHHYTRPAIWQEVSVPDILLSGDHQRIKDWRFSQAEKLTQQRRPDLWAKYQLDKKTPK